jgi:3-hydroxybutyryl-CoA dehydrogenase
MDKVAIVGAGRMGLGIAEVAAKKGLEVWVIRASEGDPETARQRFEVSLRRHVDRQRLEPEVAEAMLERTHFARDLTVLRHVDLAIESATEDFSSKAALLVRMEAELSPGALLATNTSSLSLAKLAAPLKRPEDFLALHFFNPAPVMKLVEIAGTQATTLGTTAAASAFVESLGKTPVEVAPRPGYVVNRLLVPLILHAMESLEAGVASAQDIDAAMKLGCGHPMGPLEIADLIGLDVVMAMASTMLVELNDARFRIPSLLRRLVAAGDLGMKTKRGVYAYDGDPRRPNPLLQIHHASGPEAQVDDDAE